MLLLMLVIFEAMPGLGVVTTGRRNDDDDGVMHFRITERVGLLWRVMLTGEQVLQGDG